MVSLKIEITTIRTFFYGKHKKGRTKLRQDRLTKGCRGMSSLAENSLL
jgi:hypothetical protein